MGFSSTVTGGFQLTFSNGLSVSAQWHDSAHCNKGTRYLDEYYPEDRMGQWRCGTAEIAVIGPDGFVSFGGDDVYGWASPDLVGMVISLVSSWDGTIDDLSAELIRIADDADRRRQIEV